MDFTFFRRIIGAVYTLIILIFIGLGFCYSNELNNEYRENTLYFSGFWTEDGKIIQFPYSAGKEVEIENVLPVVYGDQMLVVRAYYEDFQVILNNQVVYESKDRVLFGHKTNVGNKEIWIPLDHDYSNQNIKIKITLQDSLYGSEITEALLTTRSAYGILQMEKNVPSIVLFIIFTVTGLLEVNVAAFFILKRANLIRKMTFEALFYAGCFSIVAAQWIINETRIPFIVFGHIVGFSVLNVICFLIMPLLFFEITKSLFLRVTENDSLLELILTSFALVGGVLAVCGVVDWGNLIYFAHLLDVIVMFVVGYYSYASVREEKKVSMRTGIALANCIFIVFAAIALVQYINNTGSNYLITVIIDLLIYIMVQVGLIYRRIGLSVKEEKEFAQAKIFAFTDELTGLGNRRHFYNLIEDYEKNKLPRDLTYIAVDVNRLKYYNDTMGHNAGDELLKGTADCLRRAFSSSSTVNIARLGGDEFGVILISNEADINRRVNNLRTYLLRWRGKYINGISIALGFASVREDPNATIDDLAKLADEKMYMDKKQYYESSGIERRTSR